MAIRPFSASKVGKKCLVCIKNLFTWSKVILKSGYRTTKVGFFGQKKAEIWPFFRLKVAHFDTQNLDAIFYYEIEVWLQSYQNGLVLP